MKFKNLSRSLAPAAVARLAFSGGKLDKNNDGNHENMSTYQRSEADQIIFEIYIASYHTVSRPIASSLPYWYCPSSHKQLQNGTRP